MVTCKARRRLFADEFLVVPTLSERKIRNRMGRCVILRRCAAMTQSTSVFCGAKNSGLKMAAMPQTLFSLRSLRSVARTDFGRTRRKIVCYAPFTPRPCACCSRGRASGSFRPQCGLLRATGLCGRLPFLRF